MSEPISRDDAMDGLLRKSMAAPVPRLSPTFHQNVSRELRRRSAPPVIFGVDLLVGYGLVSVVTCAVVMHGQGLSWPAIAPLTVVPFGILEVARRRFVRQGA